VVCYCDDCQAFARWLGSKPILDAYGGTDIYQLPPAHVRITAGADELRCVRLGEKGTYRFYTACCRTPIGNMAGPRVAFIGLIHSFMDHVADGRPREDVLGPPAYVHGRYAIGQPPHPVPRAIAPAFLAKMALRILGWSLRGKQQPSAFFEAGTGRVRAPLQVLSPAERDRLRGSADAPPP
jgi:hypothetical protein